MRGGRAIKIAFNSTKSQNLSAILGKIILVFRKKSGSFLGIVTRAEIRRGIIYILFYPYLENCI